MPNARVLFGAVALLLILTAPSTAELQSPSPSRRVLGSKEKHHTPSQSKPTYTDQRGTDQSPIVVKMAPSPNAQEEATQAKKDKDEKAAADRRIEITTWTIAAATVFQAIALSITIWVMIGTARRQLRAYVFIVERTICCALNGRIIEPPKTLEAGFHPAILYRFKNSGTTPAYDVEIADNMFIATGPAGPSDFPPLKFPEMGSKETLGPGDSRLKYYMPSKDAPLLTADDIEALQRGSLTLYIYGEIRYRDTFNKSRYSKFRYFVGGPMRMRGITLGGDKEGNEAN